MLTWKEYEILCISILEEMLDDSEYRVEYQKRVAGSRRRIDISVAERRQGGRNFVFDAKHFPIADLSKNEIDSTEAYRRDVRGSQAVILLPEYANVPQSVSNYAYECGVSIVVLWANPRSGIRGYLDKSRFKKDVKWLLGK